jgi:hypothetical protein
VAVIKATAVCLTTMSSTPMCSSAVRPKTQGTRLPDLIASGLLPGGGWAHDDDLRESSSSRRRAGAKTLEPTVSVGSAATATSLTRGPHYNPPPHHISILNLQRRSSQLDYYFQPPTSLRPTPTRPATYATAAESAANATPLRAPAAAVPW